MDKTVATFATQALLAALLKRTRTALGSNMEMSMLDVIAYFNFPDNGQSRTFPDAAVELPAGRSAVLATTDGFISVSPFSRAQIRASFTAVGCPDWAEDLRTIKSPTTLMDTILDRLESRTECMTTAECEAAFLAADVPMSVVLDFDGHLADPQTVHNGIYFEDDVDTVRVRRVHHPLRFDGALLPPSSVAQAAPVGL